jgi:hypothetical protein
MKPPRQARRAAVLVGALLSAFTFAPVASAHGRGGDLVHYRSTVLSVTPPVEGLTVTTSAGGEYLRLANTGPHTIIVKGYRGETYLKLTSEGVWENQRSESTYLNKSLFGDSLQNNS